FAPTGTGQTVGGKKDNTDKPDPNAPKPSDALETILCRFVDVDVQPGYAYEYRMRIKVANPNLHKDKAVSQPTYAKVEELVGAWTDVKFKQGNKEQSWIPVGSETEIYAVATDPKPYLKPDHVRVQVQAWMDKIR